MGRSSASTVPGSSFSAAAAAASGDEQAHLRGCVRNLAGPASAYSLSVADMCTADRPANYDAVTLEYMSTEMSFNALYMHDVHRLRLSRRQPAVLSEDERARAVWQTDTSLPVSPQSFLPMANIREEDDAAPTATTEMDYLLRVDTSQNQLV